MDFNKIEIEEWPEMHDFRRLMAQEFGGGTDRGLVLLGASMLDELLRRLLESRIREEVADELLLSDRPLGSFSARVKICYGLDLITDREFKALEYVRKIRNAFAHKIDVSFETQSLRNLCENLYEAAPLTNGQPTSMRAAYDEACVSLAFLLVHHTQRVKGVEEVTTGPTGPRIQGIEP
ncbi:hypothetical protein [Microvirga lenta]|uniref:hypothetical protein n=1 Tax=Microvirga lenta TaxID=2881337 RepID=UPI001CFE8F86|nr:hypothetical protein [Microvirga lenta]